MPWLSSCQYPEVQYFLPCILNLAAVESCNSTRKGIFDMSSSRPSTKTRLDEEEMPVLYFAEPKPPKSILDLPNHSELDHRMATESTEPGENKAEGGVAACG